MRYSDEEGNLKKTIMMLDNTALFSIERFRFKGKTMNVLGWFVDRIDSRARACADCRVCVTSPRDIDRVDRHKAIETFKVPHR